MRGSWRRWQVSIPQPSSIDRDADRLVRVDGGSRSRFHSHRASIATPRVLRRARLIEGVSIPQPSSIDRDGPSLPRHPPSLPGLDSTAIEHRSRRSLTMLSARRRTPSLDSTAIEHRSRPSGDRGGGAALRVSIPQPSSIDRDQEYRVQTAVLFVSRFHSHRASIATPDKTRELERAKKSRFHSHRASIATRAPPWFAFPPGVVSIPQPSSIDRDKKQVLGADPQVHVSIPQPSSIDRDPSAATRLASPLRSRFHSHRASIATHPLRNEERVELHVSIPQPSSIDRDETGRCFSLARGSCLDSTVIEHRSRPGSSRRIGQSSSSLDSTAIEHRSRQSDNPERQAEDAGLDSTAIEHRSRRYVRRTRL